MAQEMKNLVLIPYRRLEVLRVLNEDPVCNGACCQLFILQGQHNQHLLQPSRRYKRYLQADEQQHACRQMPLLHTLGTF